jgi:hypothetical protein
MSHLFHRAEVEQLNFSEGTITIQTQQNGKKIAKQKKLT